ncbi:fimbrial protein [Moellerella wisconsensis]|uniref:Uncharacterized protein n=1 Tax=Moellerella wisconsensis TaxID=158849 RepID=A0ACD3YA69_9GAMM|nr:hypothetical protein [Moellerella wisconsensis]UNH39754.1 hypothetical protein MNY70_04700 [Moellerella wisconsensis]
MKLTMYLCHMNKIKKILFIFLLLFSSFSQALTCTSQEGQNILKRDVFTSFFYPDTLIGRDLFRSDKVNISIICTNNSTVPKNVYIRYDKNIIDNYNPNVDKVDFILQLKNQQYIAGMDSLIPQASILPGETHTIDLNYLYIMRMTNFPHQILSNHPSMVEIKLSIGELDDISAGVTEKIVVIRNMKLISFPHCELGLSMRILPANIDFGVITFSGDHPIEKIKNFSLEFTRDITSGCSLNQLPDYNVDIYFSTPNRLDYDNAFSLDNGLSIALTPMDGYAQSVKFNQPHKVHRIIMNRNGKYKSFASFSARLYNNNAVIRPGAFSAPVTINVYYH